MVLTARVPVSPLHHSRPYNDMEGFANGIKFDGEPACNPKAQTLVVLIVIGYAIGHGGPIMGFNK